MADHVIKTPSDYKATEYALQAKLDSLYEALRKAPPRALYEELGDTMAKAVYRAPKEEGHLKKSARIDINAQTYARGTEDGALHRNAIDLEGPSEQYDFEIGFWVDDGRDHGAGDVNTYAWVQHEHTEFQHPNGGQAKFLESAIYEDREKWGRAIRKAVKEAVDEL